MKSSAKGKSRIRLYALLPMVAGVSLALGTTLAFSAPGYGYGKMVNKHKRHRLAGGTEMVEVYTRHKSGKKIKKASNKNKAYRQAGSTELVNINAHRKMGKKIRKLAKKHKAHAQADGSDMVDVIVRYKKKPGQAEKIRTDKLGARRKRRYKKLKMRSLRIPAHKLEKLADNNDVEFVTVDAPVSALSVAARQTANLPAQASTNSAYDGSGVTVAVLDSGVSDHQDLNVSARVDIINPPAACSASTYTESFDQISFGGTNGWTEFGDDGSASSGKVRVVAAPSGMSTYALRFGQEDRYSGVSRVFDLSNTSTATLSFDWRRSGDYYSNKFTVQARTNGGTWQNLLRIPDGYNTSMHSESLDLTPYLSASTELRFIVRDWGDGYLYVDNIRVDSESSGSVSGGSLYLDGVGNGSDIPMASLKTDAPSGSLNNFDPQRDAFTGLLIAKGGSGLYESDSTKQQTWLSNTSSTVLAGPVSLTLWSAVKDFDTSKGGSVTAYLVDSNASGNNLVEIASATVSRTDWDTDNSATWVEDTFNFGDVNYTLGTNRFLGVKILVHDNSEDDMWFAYDAADTPSVLSYPNGLACDPLGHGTHVAGTIAGNGMLSDGVNQGVAPGADLVSLRVLNEEGQGNTSDIIAGLDWIMQHGSAYGIDVVNLSLGKGVEESAATDPLVQAAEALWDAGFRGGGLLRQLWPRRPFHHHQSGQLPQAHHRGFVDRRGDHRSF